MPSSITALFAALCVSITFTLRSRKRAQTRIKNKPSNYRSLPQWAQSLYEDKSLRRVLLREWNDPGWRAENGWQGNDLIHSRNSAVRIHEYFYNESNDPALIGIVEFRPNAESHEGLCHGGAMCSVMDDVLGWTSFVSSQGPWTGATVQVNVKLNKPVEINQVLQVNGTITSRAQKKSVKKLCIKGTLFDPSDGCIYAELDGVTIDGVKLVQKPKAGYRSWDTSVRGVLAS